MLGLLLAALAIGCARGAYGFLAPNEAAQAEPEGVPTVLVVEGWLDESELSQALAAYRRGGYGIVVTTGGPIESWLEFRAWRSYPERAAAYLRSNGVENVAAAVAPASAQDRTFLSAVVFREWARQSGVRLERVDVYSAGVHARRSRLVYRMALGTGVHVGILAARPKDYDPDQWWRTSAGAKAVIGEALGLLWTKCCFWPAAQGSHEERWGVSR